MNYFFNIASKVIAFSHVFNMFMPLNSIPQTFNSPIFSQWETSKSDEDDLVTSKYNRMFIIGDDFSDQGNLTPASSFFYEDLNPNQDFNAWKPDFSYRDVPKSQMLNFLNYNSRSFSDGPLAAEILGKKLLLNSKFSWAFQNHDFGSGKIKEYIGSNYAMIGAKILPGQENDDFFLNHFTLANQVKWLIKHNSADFNKFDEKDLFYINIGTNDMIKAAAGIIQNNETRNHGNFITPMKLALVQQLRLLIAQGAKNFIISNLMDISKLPFFSEDKNLPNRRIKLMNLDRNIQDFNIQINSILGPERFGQLFPDVDDLSIKIFDFNRTFKDFYLEDDVETQISHYKTTLIYRNNVKIWETSVNEQQSQFDKYLFFNQFNLSNWVQEKIAEKIFALI